jgi:hypothetical protein
MLFRGMLRVFRRVQAVRVRQVRVMSRRLVVACCVVLRRLGVMMGCLRVMMRCLRVMMRCLF